VIRALRSQAWHEAQKQAQLAARRFGWNWQPKTGNKASNNPTTDRTREVLQWLFG
jgi:endo-1,4-beta-D-glucanase Y